MSILGYLYLCQLGYPKMRNNPFFGDLHSSGAVQSLEENTFQFLCQATLLVFFEPTNFLTFETESTNIQSQAVSLFVCGNANRGQLGSSTPPYTLVPILRDRLAAYSKKAQRTYTNLLTLQVGVRTSNSTPKASAVLSQVGRPYPMGRASYAA